MTPQITDIHVGSAFQLGDCRLPDLEFTRQLFLRTLSGLPEFMKSHRSQHALGCFHVARAPLRHHALAQLGEGTMSCHGSTFIRPVTSGEVFPSPQKAGDGGSAGRYTPLWMATLITDTCLPQRSPVDGSRYLSHRGDVYLLNARDGA